MSSDESIERVMTGQVWADFCDQLKAAGEVVLRDTSPSDLLDRTEGWRYLSRLTRLALEQYVEHSDPDAPTLYQLSHETAKIGCDNPDCFYQNAMLDGRHRYRITGTRGTVKYLSFGTYAGAYGQGGKIGPTGHLDVSELEIAGDGTIEITLSCDPASGNWLRMTPETSMLIIRQLKLDRAGDEVAQLRIERIDDMGGPDPLSAERLATGLDSAVRFVKGTADLFADWVEGFREKPNQLVFNPNASRPSLGDPNNSIWYGYWTLGPDEALLIEAMPPECDFWNFQVNNYWEESLDYRYHNVTVNKHSATYEADGSIRLVIAHRDPGFGNWMETAGHRHGTLCLRWTRAVNPPVPNARVIAI